MSEWIEFESRDAADAAREDWSEWVCPEDVDERLTKVPFVSDTPEDVLDAIRLEAQDARTEQRQESKSVDLTAEERERISDLGGFEGRPTTFSWASAKGVFAREGMLDKFHDAMGALTDYDDPAEGAESWIQNRREADATKGTGGASGGRRDAGDTEQRRQRKAGRAARRAKGEGCEQAHDYCKGGDEKACKHLREVCGYDEAEVEEILSRKDDRKHDDTEQRELVTVGGGEYPEMEVTPQVAGALSKSWQGYKAAIGGLSGAVEEAREHAVHARQALAAINSIREAHDQDEIHGDRLHDLLESLDALPESIPAARTLDHFGDGDQGDLPDADRFEAPEQPVDGPRSASVDSLDGREQMQLRRELTRDLLHLAERDRHDQAVPQVAYAVPRLPEKRIENAIEAANANLPRGKQYDPDRLARAAWSEHRHRTTGERMEAPPDGGRPRRPGKYDVPKRPIHRSKVRRNGSGRHQVLKTDDQQTLGGGRADPQARLAGGEQGERGQGEVVEQTEQNPGGLMADEREHVGGDVDREQGDLSDVGVSEGLRDAEQGSLEDVSTDGGHPIESLQDAIDYLSSDVDGYGERIEADNEIRDALNAHSLDPRAWTEQQSQDVLRYGIDAEDVLDRWTDVLNDDERRIRASPPEYRDALIQYAKNRQAGRPADAVNTDD